MIFKCLGCGGSLELKDATEDFVKGTSGAKGEVAMCLECHPPNVFAPFIPDTLYDPKPLSN